jgi:5-methylcytosine-specific restriction endonuclease McrA
MPYTDPEQKRANKAAYYLATRDRVLAERKALRRARRGDRLQQRLSSSTKYCWACKTDRLKADFYRDPRMVDGLRSYCGECMRAKRRTEYYRDPDKARQKSAEYNRNLGPLHVEKVRRWQRANPDKVRISKDRYYAKPEAKAHRRKYESRWRMENPDKVRAATHRRRARERNARVTPVDYGAVLRRDGHICYLCRGAVNTADLSFDHVIPLSRGGMESEDNIRVAHRVCNSRKGARLPAELAWLPTI